MNRGRLEAFSDGVIAVAITLLALNLALEGPGHGPLVQQLADRWRVFVAYLISFFTVGIIWVNHHALITDLTRVDRTVLHPIPTDVRRSAWWRFMIGGLVYIVAGATAFISPQFALAIVGLTAIYYVFERGAAGAR